MTRNWARAVAFTLLGSALAAPAGAGVLDAGDDAPWNRARAAHLLRRAGFGGTPAEIARLVETGRDKAVDSLLDYEKVEPNCEAYPVSEPVRYPARQVMKGLEREQQKLLRQAVRRNQVGHAEALRQWWLARMITTNRPMEEKMTLFWHGHFTSGFREVRDWRALYNQNEFLRKNALSDFRTLLIGISKDPAMLRYLDNARNVKAKPNENYARELMELFSMGEGNYTEKDVKQAARAFTGWGLRRGQRGTGGRGALGTFAFNRRQHDDGVKTFLGHEGNFDGTDIIDIILEQPATSRYMAQRLWRFFAYRNPSDETVEALAAELRRTEYSFKAALRMLLRSDAFYADQAMHAQIKSPVELLVGTARALALEPGDLRGMAAACRQMGQDLLQPPNVKGWDGGRKWINTSTLFLRYNFATQLLGPAKPGRRGQRGRGRPLARRPDAATGERTMLAGPRGRKVREMLEGLPAETRDRIQTALGKVKVPPQFSTPRGAYDPKPTLERLALRTPEQIARHYASRLLQRKLPAEKLETLAAALSLPGRPFDPAARDAAQRIGGMIALIVSMPEYQLN